MVILYYQGGDYLMRDIKKIRDALNISQKELARKAKLSQATIHYIETGKKSPTERTLKKLSMAIGIPVSKLIEEGVKDDN